MWNKKYSLSKVRLFTWEVFTDFDYEYKEVELRELFLKDFPKTSKEFYPLFKKLISFNAVDGRRHRYLVALPSITFIESNVKNKILPESINIFNYADKLIRNCDCNGNMRYAVLVDDVFYILVFMEGRLCHWSEEIGYNKNEECIIKERLERFDNFLKKDSLFSQIDAYFKKTDFSFPYKDSPKICCDSFWKDLFLYKKNLSKNRYFVCYVISFIVLFSLIYCIGNFFIIEDSFLNVNETIEELNVPVKTIEYDSIWKIKKIKREHLVKKNKQGNLSNCSADGIKISGTISGKLVQIENSNNGISWLSIGDSLGNFVVKSIERDRAKLICEGNVFEILNGV